MRRVVTAIGVAGLVVACQPQAKQPPPASAASAGKRAATGSGDAELGTFGIDMSARKTDVKAGDDFYEHVNGGWLERYELKPDERRFGSFVALQYETEEQLKAIIDELAQRSWPAGSDEQRLVDYFASFMDVATLSDKGIAPLQPELDRIAKIDSQEQLVEAFGRAGLEDSDGPIQGEVSIDLKDPDRHILYVGHAGLGLPDRDYYLEGQFERLRVAYTANIAKLLGYTGRSEQQAQEDAKAILALETSIAKHHWPRAELRDRDKIYNLYTLAKAEAEFGGYPWRIHLRAAGIDPDALGQLVVMTPNAMAPLAKLIEQTPLSTWKAYLSHHLIKNHASLLGDEIDEAAFEFHGKVLGGQHEQRARWKRAIELIGDPVMRGGAGLGDALGRFYVERHFPPEAKQQMDALVANLRAAFRQRLETLEWMSDHTKQEALAKLDTFNPKIGYPKKWRDFSGVSISRDDLFGNYRSVRRYWHEDDVARLSRPTDRDEWQMAPHAINAYYNPPFNEIVFPAGILQPPFFDPHADPAVNYGAIGGVIGHEMGHGFDDQGSKSDARGVQRNWWTEEDRAHFDKRTQALVEQYSQYEPLEGQKLNGKLTLGENIGDLGGVTIAYLAYERSLDGAQPPVLEGTTGRQRFFLAWAQLWRVKIRDQFLMLMLKGDPHSPGRYRVNGVLRNFDPWYAAFDVQPDDALYIPPGERVSIW